MRTKVDLAIIKKVKELREKQDISQRILAEVLETTPGFIGQVESEKCLSKYSANQIYLMAQFFECAVSDIYPPLDRFKP
jgi:transcriptional regulator with XRE-family HTH domain